jgi:hypothetical protein
MGASNAGQTDCNFSRIHPQIVFFNAAEFSHLRMCVLHFVGFFLFCWIFCFLGSWFWSRLVRTVLELDLCFWKNQTWN